MVGVDTRSNDGSASMRATEQYLNLSARQALSRAQAAGTAAERKTARAEIVKALGQLDTLAALQPTIERHSLRGSAWKRLAMVERAEGDAPAAATALAKSAAAYGEAEQLALDSGHPDLFYPAANHMAMALVSTQGEVRFDPDRLARVRASLQARITSDPDFWSMVGVIELDVFEALAAGRLARTLDDLLRRYRDLKQRVAAPKMWASVADNTRFVIEPRQAGASAAERAAAERLLKVLGDYAKGAD